MTEFMKIPFTKMHGLGNDFVVVDDLQLAVGQSTPLSAELAVKICDRRWGIGADQLLWLRRPLDSAADARMEILNSDGSVAEMCGNGIRAVALYLDRSLRTQRKSSYRIETLAGEKIVRLEGDQVVVDMGSPVLAGGFDLAQGHPGEELVIDGNALRFYEVSMGNPHAVFFVDDISVSPAQAWGPRIEVHPRFPKRTNVEFVRILERNAMEVQVWERGAGITLACGTGACASAVAALAIGRVVGQVSVKLPGGVLFVEWSGGDRSVMMKGPATEVFRGEIEI